MTNQSHHSYHPQEQGDSNNLGHPQRSSQPGLEYAGNGYPPHLQGSQMANQYPPHPQYSPAPYGYFQPPQPPGKGFAITSLVLGICALLFSWIPLFGIYIGVSALVGLVMGILSLVKIKKGKADGKAMSIVGTALSSLALIITILVTVFFVNLLNGYSEDLGESVSEDNSDLTWSAPAEHMLSLDLDNEIAVI